jgi:hypothetical protein
MPRRKAAPKKAEAVPVAEEEVVVEQNDEVAADLSEGGAESAALDENGAASAPEASMEDRMAKLQALRKKKVRVFILAIA